MRGCRRILLDVGAGSSAIRYQYLQAHLPAGGVGGGTRKVNIKLPEKVDIRLPLDD